MTTVLIAESTNEGKWLTELAGEHKRPTVVEDGTKKIFSEAAALTEKNSYDRIRIYRPH